jgi:hypothetical protein
MQLLGVLAEDLHLISGGDLNGAALELAGGIFLAYYNCIRFVTQAPGGDEIGISRKEKHHTAFQKQCGVPTEAHYTVFFVNPLRTGSSFALRTFKFQTICFSNFSGIPWG